MANFTPSAGGKLEYSTTESGSYTKINGLLSIPEIGGQPNSIDTTTLDNLVEESSVDGLLPATKLKLEFNMEDPRVDANINLVSGLSTTTSYFWKITRANGVVHQFTSKVKYGFREEGKDNISGFFLYLSPENGITHTIPSVSL